jgi:2-oxoglutarate dehydrogenase E2 component (dihydrolipoamide succinyltransferase)
LLTTFNEVDMSAVKKLRESYKDVFEKKYGVKLGFMSFFVRAVVAGLQQFPALNAQMNGKQLTHFNTATSELPSAAARDSLSLFFAMQKT